VAAQTAPATHHGYQPLYPQAARAVLTGPAWAMRMAGATVVIALRRRHREEDKQELPACRPSPVQRKGRTRLPGRIRDGSFPRSGS